MGEVEEAIRLGEALAALRRERGLSQAEAGARIGMTGQGWGLYESGKRAGLFRPDVRRRLTSALGATPEDLSLLVPHAVPATPAPQSGQGMQARGRGFDAAVSVSRQRWRLQNDEMAPWAFAGVVLEYVPGQWPRRDQGCIIDLCDGGRMVRLYHRSDDRHVLVRHADGTRQSLPRSGIATVSAVVARIEDA